MQHDKYYSYKGPIPLPLCHTNIYIRSPIQCLHSEKMITVHNSSLSAITEQANNSTAIMFTNREFVFHEINTNAIATGKQQMCSVNHWFPKENMSK